MRRQISFKRAYELFRYNPETGSLRWRVAHRGTWAGSEAGYLAKQGGIQVGVDGKLYYGHCIIWLLVTGRWPESPIDHKNCDSSDNRWENLRKCTHKQNAANSRRHRDRKDDLPKGVYLDSRPLRRRYYARVFVNGKLEHLGYFSSPEEASTAYIKRAVAVHGEFARQ